MENKFISLLKFLEDLWVKKFTGQLRLNFHEGNLSEKIEKKESVRMDIHNAEVKISLNGKELKSTGTIKI